MKQSLCGAICGICILGVNFAKEMLHTDYKYLPQGSYDKLRIKDLRYYKKLIKDGLIKCIGNKETAIGNTPLNQITTKGLQMVYKSTNLKCNYYKSLNNLKYYQYTFTATFIIGLMISLITFLSTLSLNTFMLTICPTIIISTIIGLIGKVITWIKFIIFQLNILKNKRR